MTALHVTHRHSFARFIVKGLKTLVFIPPRIRASAGHVVALSLPRFRFVCSPKMSPFVKLGGIADFPQPQLRPNRDFPVINDATYGRASASVNQVIRIKTEETARYPLGARDPD